MNQNEMLNAKLKNSKHTGISEATECRYLVAAVNQPVSEADWELLAAAKNGNLTEIKQALSAGANINVQDKNWNSAVLLAAQENHFSVVEYLVSRGADINLQNQTCFNPFILGCITNNIELVKLCVRLGCQLERLTRFGGNGLIPACEKGHVEIVEFLLTKTNINVNHTNTLGWTALIEAIILGDGGAAAQKVVALLVKHGAQVTMTDEWGKTPLQLAKDRGYREICEILEAC